MPLLPRAHTAVALLVDDNLDCCEIYSAFLSRVGFRVIAAPSAGDGFSAAMDQRPDVMILDIRLGDGPDGIALMRKFRLDRRTTTIPIIVLTGDAMAADRARAMAAGCDVFLTKPCTPDVLAAHALKVLAADDDHCSGDGNANAWNTSAGR